MRVRSVLRLYQTLASLRRSVLRRSTAGLTDRSYVGCTKHDALSIRCLASRMSGDLHPARTACEADFGTLCVLSGTSHAAQREIAHIFEIALCRVCGFRVRVWEFYKTFRSFEYVIQNFQK